MLIEGIIDYVGKFKSKFITNCSFGKSIESNNSFIVISDLKSDPFNKVLVSSFNSISKEVKSVSNFQVDDLASFDLYLQLIRNSDNKLRITCWYDESTQTLSLSRELFGTIPLYYLHVPDQYCLFSTSLSNLVNKNEVKPFLDIDTKMILAHQTFGVDRKQASNSFYEKIKSVLPGHLIQISPQHTQIASFISFNISKWDNLSTPKEYGQAVFETFKNSVFSASQDDSLITASHLSGGLDSSSVSTMFKHLFPSRALHTLYHKNESKEMDESYYSKSVATSIGSIHHEVFQSDQDFNLIKLHTSLYGAPEVSNLSPSLITSMMPYANSLGCNLLLVGNGGDSIIGNGMEVLQDSFQNENWSDLTNFLQKRVAFFSLANKYPGWDTFSFEEKYHIVLQNFLYRQFSEARRLPWKNLIKLYKDVNSALGISSSYFLHRAISNFLDRITKQGVNVQLSILKDDFLNDSNFSADELKLSHSLGKGLPTKYQPLLDEVFSPSAITSVEQQFVLSKFYGVSNRSPFFDKELFELCMVVPDLIKYGDGKGREHFREAMNGLLPDVVRNRSSKATLASSHGQIITLRLYNQAQSFLNDTDKIWSFVDRKKFNDQVVILKNEKIPNLQKVRTWFHITRTISLALWLEWLEEVKNK